MFKKIFLLTVAATSVFFINSLSLDLIIILDKSLISESLKEVSCKVWINGNAPNSKEEVSSLEEFWINKSLKTSPLCFKEVRKSKNNGFKIDKDYFVFLFNIPTKINLLFGSCKTQLAVMELNISPKNNVDIGHNFYLNFSRDEIKNKRKEIRVICESLITEEGQRSIIFETVSRDRSKIIPSTSLTTTNS